MIPAQSLKLIHLFPDKMNIYGDMGNIIALEKRCQWRGILVEYVTVDTAADFEKIATGDIFFFGGGQDTDQMEVWQIIAKQKDRFTTLIEEAVMSDKVFLLICGGFQMFGKLFVDGKGNSIPGLGILDVETQASGDAVSQRCIGNVVIHTEIDIEPQTIVGFENHGGQTTFCADSKKHMHYFGKVVAGHGNTLSGGVEGCVYRNVLGSYLHGSLLPKNPHLADYLIRRALSVKYKKEIVLPPLDDTLERLAHSTSLTMIL